LHPSRVILLNLAYIINLNFASKSVFRDQHDCKFHIDYNIHESSIRCDSDLPFRQDCPFFSISPTKIVPCKFTAESFRVSEHKAVSHWNKHKSGF